MNFAARKRYMMSDIALTISILSLVAILGLWIGNFKIYGVGLGIGGVLFGGIIIGHFTHQYNIQIEEKTLHFIREFGLILFIYTIGIQVGPGFFSSLRSSGLKFNAFAALVVVLGCVIAALLNKILNVPLAAILGVLSGAVTNTPSLGAGQQILAELGAPAATTVQMGMGYAIAYPFGICGILISMWLVRLIFKVKIQEEADRFEIESGQSKESLKTMNVQVKNPNLQNLTLESIPDLDTSGVACSRLKRGDELMIPKPGTVIQLGDILHLVGDNNSLRKMEIIIGEQVEVSLSTSGTNLRVEKIIVTNEKVLGKSIREIKIQEQYDVVISRMVRAGVELVPSHDTHLQFGDSLNLVGRPEAIESVIQIVGNAKQKMIQVQMLPVFVGICLGVLVGSIPFYLPGFPAALKLGLAGGPLVVALVLSRVGSIGTLYWFMPPSGNLALREMGIVLFLAVVGLKAGGEFFETLIHGQGPLWVLCGALITLLPLLIVGAIARKYGNMNYLTLCGLLAGSMTDPPALAFANAMHPTSGASALSYATVYPMVMFLRIVSPQLMAILLWTSK